MELLDIYVGKVEEFVLAPIGDIQWTGSGENVALDHLHEHIDECNKLGAHFIGMGDYIDLASPSNRQRLRAAGVYDNVEQELDRLSVELVERLYSMVLESTAGRWLALLEGHHFWPLLSGQTTDQLLAHMLGTMHGGTSCMAQLHFSGPAGQHGSVRVWAHHGANRAAANPLSQLERKVFPHWQADVFLHGHTPCLSGMVKQGIAKVRDELDHQEARLVSTGGWAKAYVEGSRHGSVPRGDYAEQGLLPPAVIGAPLVFVYPRWKGEKWLPKIRVQF